MAKQAPSFGRIAVMVIFVMSCFGLHTYSGPVLLYQRMSLAS